jgi:hypothetical protein
MAQVIIPTVASAQISGDDVVVSGTVDGVPVTVHCWLSHLNTLVGKAAKATYVAGLMKTAAAAPSTVDLAGTYTV